MVKKISAVLLALVLCFSVVVLPASAAGFDSGYTFASGKAMAFKVELDKAAYNPGDDVIVKVYIRLSDTYELHTGSFTLGVDTTALDVTTPTGTAAVADTTTKATATTNATVSSFYNDATALNWGWQGSTIATRVEKASTEAEKAAYNNYLKITWTRNTSGSHANAGLNTNGLPGADINADTDPFITFKFKVKADAAPGTAINVGVSTGTVSSTPAQTSFKAFKNGSTTAATVTADEYDVSLAAASATVGAAGPAVAKSKAQVKMTPNSATTVEDAFSFRVTSKITDADWDTYFANSADSAATTNAIKAVGFVAYKGTAGFNLDTAKAVAQGTPAAGYDVATTDYIQKADDASDAFFGCRLDITSAATRSDVTYVAFVQYVNASGATAYAFYEAEQQALLATNYDTIVTNYLAAYPFAG